MIHRIDDRPMAITYDACECECGSHTFAKEHKITYCLNCGQVIVDNQISTYCGRKLGKKLLYS